MRKHTEHNRRMEQGQITIFVVLAMGLFLLAFAGLATDYTNFWFHRQAAQGAADASCQATAVDLLLFAEDEQTPTNNFPLPVGTPFDCNSYPTAAPCVIANHNGYPALAADNDMNITFPTSVPGVTPPPGVSVAFVQVDLTKHAPTYFSRFLTGRSTVDVHARSVCGLTSVPGPVPIVVLHPTDPNAILMNGSQAAITVIKGPRRSVQVNSRNVSSVNLTTVDLHLGGPNKTGSDFAVFGGPATAPGGVLLGTTGHWRYPSLPIPDPYAEVAAPSQPGTNGTQLTATLGQDGCPDPNGCYEYTPGYYAAGITVKKQGTSVYNTAIFRPGLYYLGGVGLELDSNSTIRIACCGGPVDGDLTGGVMFYFSGDANTSVYIDSNSGASTPCTAINTANANCIVKYHIDGSPETDTFGGVPFTVASRAMKCPGGGDVPPEVIQASGGIITGNVFLAPCTGTYGDPLLQYRGFLFFQDRATPVGSGPGNSPPNWQGGGSSLAAGFMYFHQCRAGDHTGTGTCTAFGSKFNMGGNPGTGSYAVGSLVTDKINQGGNPGIIMILNPNNEFGQLRIGFFQ